MSGTGDVTSKPWQVIHCRFNTIVRTDDELNMLITIEVKNFFIVDEIYRSAGHPQQ